MRAKAASIASAMLLGIVMLLVGLANMVSPAFGLDFLRAIGSLDPGFHVSHTLGSVLLGTFYGVVEGAIAGYIFGAVYGAMLRAPAGAASQSLNRVA